MGSCCGSGTDEPLGVCPACSSPGRQVDRLTLKALLRPEALARLGSGDYRFCPAGECPTVYYGASDSFQHRDVIVPVFQKEVQGSRTVCYCFDVAEDEIRQEVEATGVSPAAERIQALVRAERCACEVRNPQGSCCLGNVTAVLKASEALEAKAVALAPDGSCC